MLAGKGLLYCCSGLCLNTENVMTATNLHFDLEMITWTQLLSKAEKMQLTSLGVGFGHRLCKTKYSNRKLQEGSSILGFGLLTLT